MSTALITGVSTGIGLATAEKLLRSGWRIYGSVRRAEDAEDLSTRYPNHFHPLVFDVTDRAAVEKGIAVIQTNGHPLQVLINNAGIAVSGPLENLSEADIRKQFEVNVFGLLRLSQVALPLLHESVARGLSPVRIINVSSVSGYVSSPYTSLYSASKFAVEALTDGLRRELMPFGIDVISIAPGPVKTPIWEKASDRRDVFYGRYATVLELLDPYLENAMQAAIPPEEVANRIEKSILASKPKPDQIVMPKGWLIRLMRLMPKRWVDKMARKRLEAARRY